MRSKIWWRYAVIRGKDLPTDLDGKWFNINSKGPYVDALPIDNLLPIGGVVFKATHEWEQRDGDGEVAVVYRRF